MTYHFCPTAINVNMISLLWVYRSLLHMSVECIQYISRKLKLFGYYVWAQFRKQCAWLALARLPRRVGKKTGELGQISAIWKWIMDEKRPFWIWSNQFFSKCILFWNLTFCFIVMVQLSSKVYTISGLSIFFKMHPFLKSHILFYSNGSAI